MKDQYTTHTCSIKWVLVGPEHLSLDCSPSRVYFLVCPCTPNLNLTLSCVCFPMGYSVTLQDYFQTSAEKKRTLRVYVTF